MKTWEGRLASSFSRGSRSLIGELDLQQHVVNPKDLGQHPTGVTSRQNEPVGSAFRRGQLLAFGQRDRHAVRVHQQVILRQEAGEQHAVPVLVGKFLGELVDLLGDRRLVAPITGLDPPGSKLLAKRFVSQREVAERFGGIDGPPLERGTRDRFRQIAGLDDRCFPVVGEGRRQVGALLGAPIGRSVVELSSYRLT